MPILKFGSILHLEFNSLNVLGDSTWLRTTVSQISNFCNASWGSKCVRKLHLVKQRVVKLDSDVKGKFEKLKLKKKLIIKK